MVKRCGRGPNTRAITLVEVVLAAAIFSLCAVAAIGALSQGASGAARAGEAQLASVMISRLVDRLVAAGYTRLERAAGTAAQLLLPADDGGPAPQLVADGLEYRAGYQVDVVKPGLLRVSVLLSWQKPGSTGAAAPGQITVMRYVTDPALALRAR